MMPAFRRPGRVRIAAAAGAARAGTAAALHPGFERIFS
jgi:hypothetical protein